MKHRNSNRRKSNRRGVSLVETVVAMALVVTVSIVAISTMSMAMTANARDEATAQARTAARNALELFRYADNQTDFEAVLAAKLPEFAKSGTDNTYTADFGWCTLTVTADYSSSPAVFSATAMGNDGKLLFEVPVYEKQTQTSE